MDKKNFFIILIFLGFWQLSCLKEKNLFLASMQANLNSPGISLNKLGSNLMYHKVNITGHFLLYIYIAHVQQQIKIVTT